MKKIIKFALSVFLIFGFTLVSCNNTRNQNTEDSSTSQNNNESSTGNGGSESTHEHTFASSWDYDNTYHWHPSTCGHDVESDKEKHTFKEEVTDPTYASGGYTTYTCSVCGYSYVDDETSQLEHHYSSSWSHDENSHWHACTDEGYEYLKADEASHTFTSVVTDPTYASGGYTTYTCSVCGYSYVDDETSQLEHHYSSSWSHDENSHWHACTDEGYEYLKADEASHTFTSVVTDPTYASGGYTTYTCSVCGYSYTEQETPALPITITWLNYDGTVLEVDENVRYGSTPSYDGVTPTKPGDSKYSYSFSGWSPKLSSATESKTYTAQFTSLEFDKAESLSIALSRNENKPSFDDETFVVTSSSGVAYTFEGNNTTKYTNGFALINSGGYISNVSSVNGIDKINIVFSGNLTISYGWYYNGAIHYDVFGEKIESGIDYSFRNNDKPSFIKIISSGATYITSVSISFKNLLAFNRYEQDGILCEETDKYLTYLYTDEYAYVSSTLKSTPKSKIDVRIRHWYNGRPVTYLETVSYVRDSMGRYSKDTINRCPISQYAKNVFLPNTLTKATDYMFYGITGSITIEYSKANLPSGFTSYWNVISYSGDWYIRGGITIGGQTLYTYVISRRTYADTYYNSLTSLLIDSNGLIYYKDNDEIVHITGYSGSSSTVIVPSSILDSSKIVIADRAFENSKIQNITISSNVTSIGNYAFSNCTSLKKVDLSQCSIDIIPSYCFSGCTSLEEVSMNSNVKSIDSNAFYNCSSLTNIDLSNIESIGNYAFSNCTSLKKVDLSQCGIDIIPSYCFSGCTSLEEVSMNSNVKSIDSNAFYNCSSLTNIDLSNIESIGNYGFYNTGLTEVEISSNVTSIGNYAFSNCTSLKHVVYNSSCDIPSSCFSSCTSLQTIKINSAITSIGSNAFYGCVELDNVIIPDSVTSIGTSAYNNCSNLSTIVIGNGIVSLDTSTFNGCPFLKDVVFYTGSIEEWRSIEITGTFYSVNFYSESEPNESMMNMLPSGSLYWHYVDGVPTIW